MSKWYVQWKPTEEEEDSLMGGFLTQQEALDAAAHVEVNGGIVINAAFEEADDYVRTWKPVEVAVVTRADGLYRIMSNGTEFKIEE